MAPTHYRAGREKMVTLKMDRTVKETPKAILVVFGGKEIWLPLSQIVEIHRGEPPEICMTAWIAREKGMI